MSYYYEWCKKPHTRAGVMVKKADLQKFVESKIDSGFRSVYGYHPDHAKLIKARGSSKGLKEFPCFADELIIDVDNGEEGRKPVEAILRERRLSYRLYSSGGKGFHFFIPCKPMYSFHTPYSQRKFVEEELGIQADSSIYRHSGLIALEGRVHPKTRRKKEFIKVVYGEQVEIPIVKPPLFTKQLPDDYNVAANGFERIATLIGFEPYEGERYMSLWRAFKCLADAGISAEASREIAEYVNECWSQPKPDEEIDRLIEDCYG